LGGKTHIGTHIREKFIGRGWTAPSKEYTKKGTKFLTEPNTPTAHWWRGENPPAFHGVRQKSTGGGSQKNQEEDKQKNTERDTRE